jgi:hypothetical protein
VADAFTEARLEPLPGRESRERRQIFLEMLAYVVEELHRERTAIFEVGHERTL